MLWIYGCCIMIIDIEVNIMMDLSLVTVACVLVWRAMSRGGYRSM